MQKESNESGFQALPNEDIIDLMIHPKESVKVTIVYQSRDHGLNNIESILNAWPNLTIEILKQEKTPIHFSHLTDEVDIVLINEPLTHITGNELVEMLHELIFTGIIASISDGDKRPTWTKFHFGGKNALSDSKKASQMFIDWMNALVDEVEAKRLQ